MASRSGGGLSFIRRVRRRRTTVPWGILLLGQLPLWVVFATVGIGPPGMAGKVLFFILFSADFVACDILGKWLLRREERQLWALVTAHKYRLCIQCGYALHSEHEGRSCPECGSPVDLARCAIEWKKFFRNYRST